MSLASWPAELVVRKGCKIRWRRIGEDRANSRSRLVECEVWWCVVFEERGVGRDPGIRSAPLLLAAAASVPDTRRLGHCGCCRTQSPSLSMSQGCWAVRSAAACGVPSVLCGCCVCRGDDAARTRQPDTSAVKFTISCSFWYFLSPTGLKRTSRRPRKVLSSTPAAN